MPRPRTRPGPRRWLTITEAAAYSKYGRRTIYKRIADGTLPAYLPRGSRVLRIDGDDLDAMIMAEGRIATAGGEASHVALSPAVIGDLENTRDDVGHPLFPTRARPSPRWRPSRP